MATFIMTPYPAQPYEDGTGFAVVFGLSGHRRATTPKPRVIEARTAEDALAQYDTFAKDLTAMTDQPLAPTIDLYAGSRAPKGWKAARQARWPRYYRPVNMTRAASKHITTPEHI